jgi:hypothetical protein
VAGDERDGRPVIEQPGCCGHLYRTYAELLSDLACVGRLAAIATAVPPAARIRPAVSPIVPGNGDVSASGVWAGTALAANRRAISAPMPQLAPVTIVTFPSSKPTRITPR